MLLSSVIIHELENFNFVQQKSAYINFLQYFASASKSTEMRNFFFALS